MSKSRTLTPFLWFDSEAEEAAEFYVSAFGDGQVGSLTHYTAESAGMAGRPEGSVMTAGFEVAGQGFVALNGGPLFSFTPALSFFVNCSGEEEARALFDRLGEGGTALMPFDRYPFSPAYGWVADRFGVTWQINSVPRADKLAPCLLFVGNQCGRAEEAMNLYMSLFPQSRLESIDRYAAGEGPDAEGTVRHAVFSLGGQEVRIMDSAHDHRFTFTEAISLQVLCDTQAEIDRLWDGLAEGGDPEAQRCGWLKDRFGVSWQIVPRVLSTMLGDADRGKASRVTDAFLQMKKFDIATLERAFEGR